MADVNPALCRFIDALIDTKYHTASALASAIGMSVSAFSRAIREEGSLSTENCLRLAEATGQSPSKILRLAHREHMTAKHIADVVDHLLSGRDPMRLSDQELGVIALWRNLEPAKQHALLALMRPPVDGVHNSGVGFDAKGKTPRTTRSSSPAGSSRPAARKLSVRTSKPVGSR